MPQARSRVRWLIAAATAALALAAAVLVTLRDDPGAPRAAARALPTTLAPAPGTDVRRDGPDEVASRERQALRTEADPERGEPAPAPPARVQLAGRLFLGNSDPLPDTRLTVRHRSGDKDSLGEAITGADGRFSLALERELLGRDLQVQQTSHPRLGQDSRPFLLVEGMELDLHLSGCRVPVHVADADGAAVERAVAWGTHLDDEGRPLPGRAPAQARTDATGRCSIDVAGPGHLGIHAESPDGARVSATEVLSLASGLAPPVALTLGPRETGEIHVTVVDEDGRAVDSFAVRVNPKAGGWIGAYRMASEVPLRIAGVPLGTHQVELQPVYGAAPALYRSRETVEVEVRLPGSVAEVRFTVPVEGGALAFEVRGFLEGGLAIVSDAIEQSGRTMTGPLDPGTLRLRLVDEGDRVLWQGAQTVVRGARATVPIDLSAR